jgi:GntR family transcriptional regulator/MocR family aminotransferase
MEAYAHGRHRDAIAAHGLEIRTLPVDSGGASVSELGDADAALLTPAHQFPFGSTLAPERRSLAVEWALDRDRLLIEDDYDGEFRYDRRPVGAMQALAPERVVYAGTASKTLVPGLRLGWLVLPANLVEEVVTVKARSDWHTSSLEQLTLAEFIASGDYDRHVRRSRLAYRRRRDRLAAALGEDVRIAGTAAGLHALLELRAGRSEANVIARAAERGLALEGLGAYRTGAHRHGPALVVGYATPPEHAFTAALARLKAALAD